MEEQKLWYVVNTYSGHESKVRDNLLMRAQSMGMENNIFRVIVPEQKEVEIKGSDLNQLRMDKLNKENEVLEQQKIIDENGITVNADGTFSIEQSTQSENGNTTTSQKIKLTSNTLEGLLEQMKEKNMEIKGMEEENQ